MDEIGCSFFNFIFQSIIAQSPCVGSFIQCHVLSLVAEGLDVHEGLRHGPRQQDHRLYDGHAEARPACDGCGRRQRRHGGIGAGEGVHGVQGKADAEDHGTGALQVLRHAVVAPEDIFRLSPKVGVVGHILAVHGLGYQIAVTILFQGVGVAAEHLRHVLLKVQLVSPGLSNLSQQLQQLGYLGVARGVEHGGL